MWNISLPVAKADGMDVCPPSSPVSRSRAGWPGFLYLAGRFSGFGRHRGTIEVLAPSKLEPWTCNHFKTTNGCGVPRGRWRHWALWALGWLAVPPLLKHQAQKIASEKLGRTVTVGAVDFKPWSLELTLSDLAIATADGKTDQVRIKRIYIDGELQSLLRLAPVVDAITVDEPMVRLTHLGDGRYDIDDILKKLTPPADQPAGEPAKFALYNLALNGGSFDFIDTAVGKTHTVRELDIAVPFLSNLDSKRDIHTDPLLAFKLNGSAFNSSARTTPFAQTRKTDATLKLQAMDLTPYLGYIPASVPVRLQAAVLDADLKLAFEQNPEPVVRLSGVVQLGRVKVADAHSRTCWPLTASRSGWLTCARWRRSSSSRRSN